MPSEFFATRTITNIMIAIYIITLIAITTMSQIKAYAPIDLAGLLYISRFIVVITLL